MTVLTVEPPEYYPVVEKLFAGNIRDALETLGVELVGMKVGVKPVGRVIKLAFLFEIRRPETFLPGELDSIISGLLEKLAEDATRTFGRLYDARFQVAGFRTIEAAGKPRKEEINLVVNCPDDIKRTIERLGKGLVIYLKDKRIDFSTIVLNMPPDGRPQLTITLLLPDEKPSSVKENLAKDLTHKASSYLRTLNAEYISVRARVLDPGDKTVGIIMKRLDQIEKEAEELAEMDEIRDLMSVLGKETRES
ncbi:hypothetical protein GQS_00985 [Thermococcus sp. 4557]|uniref:hypothetical protein n=1 Tax=Thermococcus sp. (strain CGMCC 1.5172 / 4557) TaxID=1042877 RepID=UPI000219E9FD|nr:hypothetical protein [Thermococcus sp. 4557]AEK72100.1 hypothetical protein GQS_00985 [Thermococcus sp. 4557]